MKKFLVYSLLVMCVCFLANCQRTPESKEKIVKIALVAPLTGDIAAMGQGMKNGATLAIEEANEQKIVKGVRFELLALDDRADPKEAVNVANQIVSDRNIYGVVGHLNSGCSIPASTVYNRHNLVMISPASTNPKLTLQGFKNVFRTCTTDDVQGGYAAEVIHKDMKIKQVAIIHDKTPYGQGLAEEFKKTFEKLGGKVLCFEGISLGDRDFKALLIKVKGLNPEMIYFGGMYQEAGLISKQAKELTLSVPIVGGDGIFSNEYIKIAGKSSEGDLATMVGLPPEKLIRAKEFIKKYKERFPQIDMQPYDSYTYDTTQIIIEVVKSTKLDKEKMIEYVRNITYQGIIGKTQFDEKGDTLNKTITFYHVKNGQWEVK